MSQTFKEYIIDCEYKRTKCNECGALPIYVIEDHYLCEICIRKEYEKYKK